MSDYRVVEVERVMGPAEATELVGVDVGDQPPTVTDARVAVDRATGEPVYAYLPLGDVARLRRAVRRIAYNEGVIRQDGQRNKSRTFGYRSRRPVYGREGCGPTALANDHPDANAVVCGFADRLAVMLGDIDPRLVDRGETAVTPVEPDWRLGESKLWTSGVINQTAVLPYHRDGFNFPAWSAMPVLRRHVAGGHLRIPEYDATIACRDGWAVFFAGYDLVHGVTPMRLTRPDGYRFSIVYYALKGMKDCFTAAVETRYARRRRTEREQDMARRARDGDLTVRQSGAGLPADGTRGESNRSMGGRPVLGGRDPRLSKKQSGRLVGGRSGPKLEDGGRR